MLIFTEIGALKQYLTDAKNSKKSVGFVPTMGALHMGHISLIQASKKENDLTVCSIFVNPTQFNDKKDLERYPKTPEKDLELLKNDGCDAVFMPSVEEMYPQEDKRVFDFGYLDKILEGAHRPGHFNGVAQVVSKFFDIVQPTRAYFGSKDYQQVMIVKSMSKQLGFTLEIIPCPILREADGLAMSSRNMLLNAEEREASKLIPVLMNKAKALRAGGSSISEIKKVVETELNKNSIYRLDYFSICNAETLHELDSFENGNSHVALIACFVGKIRLIDNILI